MADKWLSTRLICFTFLLLILATASIVGAQQASLDDAQNSEHTAYNAIVAASSSGVDVNNLILQLNQALNLSSQAQALINSNPQQAQTLAAQAKSIAENVTAQASAAKESGQIMAPLTMGISAASLLVAGCVVYFYGPSLFWKTWLRFRKNYHVKAKNGSIQSKGLVITWEQVCAVFLGVTVVLSLIVTVPFFLPKGRK